MIKIMVGLLVLLIIMVQVFCLESLKAHRRGLLGVFTLVLAVFFYYCLRDEVSATGRYVDRTKASVAQWSSFSNKAKASAAGLTDAKYETIYLEAILAYEKEDYDIASIYFNQLYILRPKDTSYYRDYANTLLFVDPQNPLLRTFISALLAEPERDLSLWLLFARYEQVSHNDYAARRYYDEALALATPGTPLYSAIKEQSNLP